MLGLSLVAASGGHSSSRCAGLSLSWPLLLRSTGSRRAGSAVVAHGPSRSAACGILPDQGSNPCPLHWQADSQPLYHQGSPEGEVLTIGPPGKSQRSSSFNTVFSNSMTERKHTGKSSKRLLTSSRSPWNQNQNSDRIQCKCSKARPSLLFGE